MVEDQLHCFSAHGNDLYIIYVGQFQKEAIDQGPH